MANNKHNHMKAKWKNKGIYMNIPYMLIESGPSIKELYAQSKDILVGKGLLIIAIDGPSLLSKKDKKILLKQMDMVKISATAMDSFLWISPDQVANLFEKTLIGSSGDSCLFFNKQPNNFTLHAIPKIKGILHDKFSDEVVSIFDRYGSDVISFANDSPDLLIITKDTQILEHIDKLVDLQ